MSYREIHSPADEQRLLTEIIHLRTEVRKRQERERLTNLKRAAQYETIFNPITKTMQSLLAPQAAAGDSSEAAVPPALPPTLPTLPDIPATSAPETPVKNKGARAGSTAKAVHTPSASQPTLYAQALSSIKRGQREKGALGLRADDTIAGYKYNVAGNVLHVNTGTGTGQSFTIPDPEVWRLLLVHAPSKAEMKAAQPASLDRYRQIILQLGVPGHHQREGRSRAKKTASASRLRVRAVDVKREKFKIISGSGLGSNSTDSSKKNKKKKKNKVKTRVGTGKATRRGYLFSTEGPSKTIVIPRADRALLRNLSLALSEMRAGNEGERESCVQLSREARKRGILPPHLMTKEEMLWSSQR